MSGFPWLPIGTALPGGTSLSRLQASGTDWQLCGTQSGARVALLLRTQSATAWWRAELDALAGAAALEPVGEYLCLSLPSHARPLTVAELSLRSPSVGRKEAEELAAALAALRRHNPLAAWASALFLPEQRLALAAAEDAAEDRRAVFAAALSGGMRDGLLPPERIAQLNPRLDSAAVLSATATALDPAGVAAGGGRDADQFVLPGQPLLQAMLREQVLDVLQRPAEYARLGVTAPAGVLLAGPPGCGKSHAAAALAHFLGWPLHEISVASVGSAWLHETSRKLAEAFDAAAAHAPAIVLLEELDAIGKSRGSGFGPTVEELNTLLRLVEHAPGRRLLVVGTTNRLDAIDPALRRRGRFDQVFVMDHADERGTAAMLEGMIANRPHAASLDLASAARRLARRPASDAVWVVNEAARLAVRGGHDAIDDLLLARALNGLGAG